MEEPTARFVSLSVVGCSRIPFACRLRSSFDCYQPVLSPFRCSMEQSLVEVYFLYMVLVGIRD